MNIFNVLLKKYMVKPQNLVLIFCGLILIYLTYRNGVNSILTWDIFGHYLYLPMIFNEGQIIHKDLSYFEHVNEMYQNTPYFYQLVQAENGVFITKYTAGWAVLMSPFYFIAKLICQFTSFRNDGFSLPFQYCLTLGATFYSVVGLYFVKKIVNHFYDNKITAIVLLILVFGTNYLFMNYAANGSSNNLEFSVVASMLWFTIKFHENYKTKYIIGLGFSIGLLGLIRPPDLILVLIPLTWNVQNFKGILLKMKLLFANHRIKILVMILIVFVLFFLQIGYWYLTTGKILMNSYANNAGEGFDWFTPYLFEVLFSFRKGWFLYTPIMIFSVIGLFLWVRKFNSKGYYPVITFFIFLYVVSSWTTWWYADSFSQRALIDIYPLLALGLGSILLWIQQKKKYILGSCLFVLVLLNLFQTYQMEKGILHTSRMTRAYYFSVFGQISPPTDEQKNLLLIDQYQKYLEGFNDKENYHVISKKYVVYPKNTFVNSNTIYSPIVDLPIPRIMSKDHVWIKSRFKYEGSCSSLKGKIFNAAAFYHGRSYQFQGRTIEDSLVFHDSIKRIVEFNYLSPDFRSKNDMIRIGVYHQFGDPLRLKSVEIMVFENKK